jgi:glycosyltransferase involved in cell wall biosynthesis
VQAGTGAVIVLDARNARMGGGRNFVEELAGPLGAELGDQGEDLSVLDGPPQDFGTRWRYRRALLGARATLHAGNRASPARRGRHVVCVRDRLLLSPTRDARTLARQGLLLVAMGIADALVVPSQSMVQPTRDLARRIRRRVPVHVVPHGRPQWTAPADRPLADPVALLYPSHVGTHKNFPVLAGMMERLSAPATLTLTARASDELDGTTLGVLFSRSAGPVRFIGPVDRTALASLYEAHDVLVFPSRCEAFGLPLLEAMTMNMPVLASRHDWGVEICGTAASYADGDDEQEWVSRLDDVVAKGVRANREGVARSQTFDWRRAASQYASLLLAA